MNQIILTAFTVMFFCTLSVQAKLKNTTNTDSLEKYYKSIQANCPKTFKLTDKVKDTDKTCKCVNTNLKVLLSKESLEQQTALLDIFQKIYTDKPVQDLLDTVEGAYVFVERESEFKSKCTKDINYVAKYGNKK